MPGLEKMNLDELEAELLSKIRGKLLSKKQDLSSKLEVANEDLRLLKDSTDKSSDNLSKEKELETDILDMKEKLDDLESEAKTKAILAIDRVEQVENTVGIGGSKTSVLRAIDIKNPLTMIALFVTILELAAFIVLPQLLKVEVTALTFFNIPVKNYIHFLIFFPVFVVTLFFILLWYRPQNLYSPSDFKNEDNYVKVLVQLNKLAEKNKELEIDSGKHEEANILIANFVPKTSRSLPGSISIESFSGPNNGGNTLLEDVKNIYRK